MDFVLPQDDGKEGPGALRRMAALRRAVAVGGRRGVAAVFTTLTRPLPGHFAAYREPSRSALALAALVIVLASQALPQQAEIDGVVLLVLGTVTVAFTTASLLRRCHAFLNRYDGLVSLVLTATLVAVGGGAASIYRPLLLLVVVYAALFYDTGRLAATGMLILAVLLAPLRSEGFGGGYLAELIVQVPVWVLLTAVVHVLVQRIRTSAQTDGLTGLSNHMTFWTLLHAEHLRMRRYDSHYSVLLIDLDHFKHINDTHGHRTGDDVLRGVGRVLRGRARLTDVVARYGGEEFALLLPETDRGQALQLAEQLRVAVADEALAAPVTISIGVVSSRDGFAATPEEILAAVDRALYQAKNAGRNRVVTVPPKTAAFSYLTEPR